MDRYMQCLRETNAKSGNDATSSGALLDSLWEADHQTLEEAFRPSNTYAEYAIPRKIIGRRRHVYFCSPCGIPIEWLQGASRQQVEPRTRSVWLCRFSCAPRFPVLPDNTNS